MNKLFVFISLFLMAFCSTCMGQQAHTLHFQWHVNGMPRPANEVFVMNNNSKGLLLENNTEKRTSFSLNGDIKYTVHHEAIFCRMEDALRQHFNIWLKFRMGTEDKYSD